jgi:hypothetical protein
MHPHEYGLTKAAYSVNETLTLLSLGRTSLYQLVKDGDLIPTKIGKKTLHALGPAPFAYFLREIEAGADVDVTLEEYAALPAEFIRALGGDWPFPHARRRRGMTIQPDRGRRRPFSAS